MKMLLVLLYTHTSNVPYLRVLCTPWIHAMIAMIAIYLHAMCGLSTRQSHAKHS